MNKPVDKKLELKKRITVLYDLAYDDGFKAGMQRAVEMNVVKELTDEEIAEIYKSIHGWDVKIGDKNWIGFARELLRKVQQK